MAAGTPRGRQDRSPGGPEEHGLRQQGTAEPGSVSALPFLGSFNPKGPCPCPGRPALTLGMAVAEGGGAHVAQPDGAFAAAVDKGVAVVRVELGGRDHLRQLLHVGWFDVHDVWQGESRSPTQPSPAPAPPSASPPAGVSGHLGFPSPPGHRVFLGSSTVLGQNAVPRWQRPAQGTANIRHILCSSRDRSSSPTAWGTVTQCTKNNVEETKPRVRRPADTPPAQGARLQNTGNASLWPAGGTGHLSGHRFVSPSALTTHLHLGQTPSGHLNSSPSPKGNTHRSPAQPTHRELPPPDCWGPARLPQHATSPGDSSVGNSTRTRRRLVPCC